MTPVAGVILLVVHDQGARRRCRIGPSDGSSPTSGTRPSLFTIRFSTRCEVLGPRLEREPPRRVAVGAAVVHVDVEVAAVPAAAPPGRRPPERRPGAWCRASARTSTVRRSTRYSGPRETSTRVPPGREREHVAVPPCGSSRTRSGARARSKPSSACRQASSGAKLRPSGAASPTPAPAARRLALPAPRYAECRLGAQ